MDEQPDGEPREGGPFAPGGIRTRSNLQRASLALWVAAGLLLAVLAVLVVLVVTGR